MKRRAREKQENGEDRQPILKRLRAALLRLFRGQHGEKMVCVVGVHGVTGTLGRLTAISIQHKRGWGPHHHLEAAND